ncbi:response regulator [Rariglobus hedericola]|uniref:Response regulator n=1 Tax=Rariglobus hedericola TaxID=2597822 RepID=A0A556QQM2_9BACT|nr:response regulator [Rariglobus hedericola]TSJ78929.1 response regulator [Rariglobus hedericola]
MTTPAALPAPALLVIDDEAQIRRLLRVTLEAGGYRVREAETGAQGLHEIALNAPDGIILDLGLPDMDGGEVVRRLREWSRLPVLVLSVRGSEDDKIAALDAGADDYLTKPFGGRELLARVRAILRRVQSTGEQAIVQIGDIEIDQVARLVRRKGEEVHLTAKEYALLRLLVQHRGKVVTHRQILRELWGPQAEENTHYLRVQMTHLRQKLEANPQTPQLLKTEPGVGYRLIDATA